MPVFRYALEHWYPDPYQAVILHRGAISDDDEALVAKLMIYALGRSLEISDQPVVDDLTKRFVNNDYKLVPLMREIVTSEPFLER